MNRPLRILAVLALGAIAGCASRNNKYERDYIGTWYAQGQDSSFTWKLDADGDFGQAKGFVTPKTDDGSWRVDRGQLIIQRRQDGKKQETRAKASVVGNTLTIEEDGRTTVFTKIGE
jgi:hypothetical protein